MMRRSMTAALMLVAATLPSSAGTVQGVVQGTKTAGQGTAEAGAASRNVPRRSREAQGRPQSASPGAARTIVKKTGNGVWCVVTHCGC